MMENRSRKGVRWRLPPAKARLAIVSPANSHASFVETRVRILLQPVPDMLEFFAGFRFNSLKLDGIELAFRRPMLSKQVILDFGLRSRRTHSYTRSVFQSEDRHLLLRDLVAFHIFYPVSLEIFDACYSYSEHF